MFDSPSAQIGKTSPLQIRNAIIEGVQVDGEVLGYSIRRVDSANYQTEGDEWLVALVYDNKSQNFKDWDYHWFCRTSSGTWEHKPGSDPIKTADYSGNIIWDPKTCDRDRYNLFLGYYVVTPNN